MKLTRDIRSSGVAATLVVHEHKRPGRGIELAMLAEELKTSDVGLEFLTGELKGSHDPSRTDANPALAVFDNKLHCVQRGHGNGDQDLWYTTLNGSTWSTDTRIPNHKSSAGPAAITYRDKHGTANQLLVVHRGSGSRAAGADTIEAEAEASTPRTRTTNPPDTPVQLWAQGAALSPTVNTGGTGPVRPPRSFGGPRPNRPRSGLFGSPWPDPTQGRGERIQSRIGAGTADPPSGSHRMSCRNPGTRRIRVVGDSVIDAAICDGDYVVVQQSPTARHGDIVAALLDGEATVKRLHWQDGQVRLMPHNPAYQPIPGDNATILGKVVTVIRTL